MRGHVVLGFLLPLCASSVPTLDDLAGDWVSCTAPVSQALPEQLGAAQRDLATINNFRGSLGIAPEGVRPVDLFGVNSIELPPFAGCGGNAKTAPYGCGGLSVDGSHVDAAETRWTAHEAGRRSAPLPGSGLVVSSATRMGFEVDGILWKVNFTNPSQRAVAVNATFGLQAMVSRYATVGNWVYGVPGDPAQFGYSPLTGGQKGVLSVGIPASHGSSRPAASRFVFVGSQQPTAIRGTAAPGPSHPPSCSIAGDWIQESSGETFHIAMLGDNNTFNLTHPDPDAKRDGWAWANGTCGAGKCTDFVLSYFRPASSPGTHGYVFIHGSFTTSDCQHATLSDSNWHRPGADPGAQAPVADFTGLTVPAGATVTIRVAMSIGANAVAAAKVEAGIASTEAVFDGAWARARDAWEERWQQAFTPDNQFFSGHLPTLSLPSDPVSAGVSRVFYVSILSVFSQLRTNLPIVFPRVFVNGQGNIGSYSMGGIGGSRSWWWDEGLTSLMLALLEPAGRPSTFQAWLDHDVQKGSKFGHGLGNGYAMDCSPPGEQSCGWPSEAGSSSSSGRNDQGGSPEYGFYCYNPHAYFSAMSNHLRVNNDTAFLEARASSSNMTVDEALESIALDHQEYLIPGTNLVDYGPAMDGFSPSYKHVMPGCSQGNNAYMLREIASLRETQGHPDKAAELRAMAKALVQDTMNTMYRTEGGHGFFNVIFPPANGSSRGTGLTAYEMRHAVDMFSVTFGFCGLTSEECDFSPAVREQLAAWFVDESVTSTWIRATSPKTNCSRIWSTAADAPESHAGDEESWPAYTTCQAGRPDHGSNGAYPSWPAFACEALGYLDGNTSRAFKIMSSFAANTREGPFGQAHEVPQMSTPPYTPFNNETSFKPIAGVTRYIAIEGGSFFDAIVRGFFGFHPPMLWKSGTALHDVLANPTAPRGFSGEIRNLRTPLGLATITATPDGLSIKPSV